MRAANSIPTLVPSEIRVRPHWIRGLCVAGLLAISAGLPVASSSSASARSEEGGDPPPPPGEYVRGQRIANRIRRGLVETVVADSLRDPVSFALAPDGRAFVCEQGGALRVVRDGGVLARPFLVVPTEARIEEGLLGVALHPEFARTRWVYVLYTAGPEPRRERLERWTADGDTALAGSGVVLLELDPHVAANHVGGLLRFALDGRLLIGTGDNEREMSAQSLGSTFGKILRLDADGGIPDDNPFVGTATGHHRAIWARGFRNVWGLDVQPSTGRVFANDVGGSAREEVNAVTRGANHGWPFFEGASAVEPYVGPVHDYGHDAGCAITAGTFHEPARSALPGPWRGRYFFAEYCWNEIRWLDPARPERHGVFGTTLVPGPVDMRTGPDGALWMLLRGNSAPVGGAGTAVGMLVRVARAGEPGSRATRPR